MAFNPFHGFRKHQKTLFAGLTIMCMVIFVLQFGRGDIFSSMTNQFGKHGVDEKDRAAVLYGQVVSGQDVAEIRRQREVANTYMLAAIGISHNIIVRNVDAEILSKLAQDDPARQDLQQILQQWMGANSPDPQIAQFRNFFVNAYVQGLGPNIDRLERLRMTYAAAKKDLEASLVLQLQRLLRQDQQLYMSGNQPYFGGGSLKSLRDLLDFKIWLHQADKLGIQLTQSDTGKLINQEALGQMSQPAFREVDKAFSFQYRSVPREFLVKALADEFRVRLAKAALLGYDMRPDVGVPPAVTPYEYWSFFRENRTENIVELLPIPVRNADFLAKAGKPTEEELTALYDKYKDIEPASDSPVPGFREPARVEVQWVSARPDSEYYQNLAKKDLQIVQSALEATSGSLIPYGGIASAVTVAVPSAFDLQLLARYEQEKFRFRAASWTDAWNTTLHDTSRNRAENAASLIGQVTAGLGTGYPLTATPAAFETTAFYREARERSRIWATLFLAGAGESPLAAAGMAYAMSPKSEYLPLEEIRPYVAEKLQESTARELVAKNLTALREELEKLSREQPDALRKSESASQPTAVASGLSGAVSALATGSALSGPLTYGSLVLARDMKQGDQLAGASIMAGATGNPWSAAGFIFRQQSLPERRARSAVAQAIERYHLRHGSTKEPRNRLTIAEDPGLQPLKAAFERSRSLSPRIKDFAQMAVPAGRAFDPQPWPRADFSSMQNAGFQQMQMAEHIWRNDEEPFLYWKTGDLPAYVPAFAEARPKVEEAWRFEKARKLAEEEAEKVAAEARKAKGDADRVLKDGSPHSGKAFTLDRVAKLTKPTFAVQSRDMGNVYQPYRIPEDKVEYPGSDFLLKLVGLKDRGEVVVLSDRPQSNYYVAALVFRAPPDEKSFYEDYAKHAGSLLAQIEQQDHQRDKFRDAVTQRLEKEADLKIFKDFRDKYESGRGGSDEE